MKTEGAGLDEGTIKEIEASRQLGLKITSAIQDTLKSLGGSAQPATISLPLAFNVTELLLQAEASGGPSFETGLDNFTQLVCRMRDTMESKTVGNA